MIIYIIFVLFLLINIAFLVKKEKFNNYSYIPEFSIYQYEDKLYKLNDKNQKIFFNTIDKSQINNKYLNDNDNRKRKKILVRHCKKER